MDQMYMEKRATLIVNYNFEIDKRNIGIEDTCNLQEQWFYQMFNVMRKHRKKKTKNTMHET